LASLQPSSVFLGLQFAVIKAMRPAIDALGKRRDSGIVDTLIAN
jgi:hypothetical protein